MKIYLCLLFSLLISNVHYGQVQDTTSSSLTTVIVSASKLKEKRIESPIAISVLSSKLIDATKANRIDFLLNKVSGVFMPTIGNEQHMMSIRQPISLKGLYLYLEDGMPIRTSGLFSNNALIEINTGNIQSIEVIKGPASALYGAEAIGGVVNFLSKQGSASPLVQLSSQLNSLGLKKIDFNWSGPTQKGTWLANAAWSSQRNGPIEYSNFEKKAVSLRHDFSLNKKWSGYQSLQWIDYNAQMTGSVDSLHFAQKNFNALQTFTFRKILAVRIRQNIEYAWNANSTTRFNFMYRNNTMDQNPTYSIASTNNPLKFKGQENSNQFDAYVLDVQQVWNIKSIASKFIIGGYLDKTNQHLIAHYINIDKDSVTGKYAAYHFQTPDSLLTNYSTSIYNKAVYANIISTLSKTLKLNMSLRYDNFEYLFNNELKIGTPSSNNNFSNWSPKIGFTFNKAKGGGYMNYSVGFVPPQITEIYNAIRVPYLLPQQFKNIEIGGWYQLKKIYAEISLYQLNGENEIISVRQTDGVNLNQNSGQTKHIGIEYQLKYLMNKNIELHWNGTNAKHTYLYTIIKGTDISGNRMNAAPAFFSNLSAYWKHQEKLQASIEWQHQSSYFMDEINATSYPGFDVINLRMSYKINSSEYWIQLLNAANTYYSTMATKNFSVHGNSGYAYYIGEPRSFTIGWKWTIKQ